MLNNIKCIRFAQKDDLKHLSELFNLYRIFYGCDSDLALATTFLTERLEQKDSVIFVAETEDNLLAGFTQLYPTFSSVAAKRAWILNDLYISNNFRRRGIANQLIQKALEYCRDKGAAWLTLQTGQDNRQAQALYEQMGFTRENYFYGFSYQF
jgi:ribosomal protein S18 acetylase RimI-like enzyme